ncbi:MAG: solute carrier family 26 protein [Cyclobacteriaceae bacterium]|nr:solute carrier family 26 protein [Cyclobacteriaceae bacterium]
MNIKKYVPIADWLASYSKQDLSGDISAGLTVGVMLIPQGMAYSMLAGLPPIYGLYAATIPLILYAIFGTSRQLAVGPVAMVSLLIASGVGSVAEIGTPEFIGLAIVLALMVGVMQLFLGVSRLGFLVNFLSHPVISGFTSAAALIIGLNQLKHLLGISIGRSNYIHTILYEALMKVGEVHFITFLIGAGGIATILLVKKLNKKIPGPLVAVVLGILVVYLFGLHEQGVKIVMEVPSGLPPFSFPSFGIDDLGALLPAALTISLVGFMESIAVAKAIQSKHKNYSIDANQELIALGMANIGGAFFSSFPTTGGFSRTAVNDQAGARTGLASLFSAVLILLTLLFLTPLFYYLPQAILASVIMVAVFGLIDYKEVIHLWKTDKTDLVMLVVSFFATLATGIEEGIAIGVLLSLGFVLYRASYPHTAVLGRLPGTDVYRNVKRFPEVETNAEMFIYRFDAQLFFANSHFFRIQVEDEMARNKKLRLVIINAEAINSMDSSAIHMIDDMIVNLREHKIDIAFAGVKGPVRDIMVKSKLLHRLGVHHFFDTIQEAVDWHFGGKKDRVGDEVNFQTNLA